LTPGKPAPVAVGHSAVSARLVVPAAAQPSESSGAGASWTTRMAASHNGHPSRYFYPGTVALRCLIVDDNPGFLHAARALLEQEGIRVVGVASTGAEALRRAEDLCPDVTLLDIDLGEDSGFDVAQQLVDDPRIDPGHLILVSAYAEDEFFDLIEASPAIGFLRKPALSVKAIEKMVRAVSGAGGGRGDTSES
jgi:CheY-like chemotaxis protein